MSLKTSLLVAGCALLIGSAARAQSPLLNVAIGPTYAWRMVNQPALESDGMIAMGGGGGFRFGRGALGIQTEVLITTKATKQTNDAGEQTRLRLEYIEIPVFGIVTIGDGQVRPFFGAGATLDLEMRCKAEFVKENSKDEIGCDLANTATFDRHKVDIGATGLAGLDYKLSEGRRISLQARYNHGLRNISDSDDPSLVLKNRSLSFFVGYSFPLKTDME